MVAIMSALPTAAHLDQTTEGYVLVPRHVLQALTRDQIIAGMVAFMDAAEERHLVVTVVQDDGYYRGMVITWTMGGVIL